ncbi:MAG: polysaccharide biosynthesis protein [Rhizobiaceae bacterium]
MNSRTRFKENLLGLRRVQKRAILMVNDAALAAASLWLAFFLRIGIPETPHLIQLIPVFSLVALGSVLFLWLLGFYNNLLRELEIRILNSLGAGVLLTAALIVAFGYFDNTVLIPRSIPAIFSIVFFLLVGCSRLFGRWYYRYAVGLNTNSQPIIIYGAGETGTHTASILDNSREFSLIGFVDDDKSLHGNRIRGRRIFPNEQLGELSKRYPNLRVLICISNLSSEQRRQIIENLQAYPIQVLTVPSLSDVVAGRARSDDIKEVKLSDLLGRDQIPPKVALFEDAIIGKTLLVSGGGGSIGSEICLQLAKNQPKKIIVIDSSEFALYQLEQRLQTNLGPAFDSSVFNLLLCDVLDETGLERILDLHKPEVVYHAAAYKHVPIVERQPLKGIENNIIGTDILARLCAKAGVKQFTLVSTDKAVRPTNVMGATKRVAELVVQARQLAQNQTKFTIVRFGNVLGSSGSVIPLFREQIAAGGPVTVTHPDVTRFFMTIPEAAQLVIQAGFLGKGGEVFVLDMGEPVLIQKLARLMIQLSGKTAKDENNPGGEIQLEFSGLRPGEKLYEELHLTENVEGTTHPKIMLANELCLQPKVMERHIRTFRKVLDSGDRTKGLKLLSNLVEGFEPDLKI